MIGKFTENRGRSIKCIGLDTFTLWYFTSHKVITYLYHCEIYQAKIFICVLECHVNLHISNHLKLEH